MPPDFPVAHYESVHSKIQPRASTSREIYEQFGGAWNAIAYRYLAVTEYEAAFTASLVDVGTSPQATDRHQQERDLFGFFGNGFAVFEAAFYSLFALGALVSVASFPISTAKEQQRINPTSTTDAITKAFPNDPIVHTLNNVTSDSDYLDWREVRNVLTHRAAPGRIFFASVGGGTAIADQWKIKSITLDVHMAPARRAELSRLISDLLEAIDQFAATHL